MKREKIGIEIGREDESYRSKPIPVTFYSLQNSSINYQGSNPGSHVEIPTKNRLKHGTALLHFIALIVFNEDTVITGSFNIPMIFRQLK
jgi:hypothetical protein